MTSPARRARIHTYPHREDLAAMEADIRAAKAEADVVVVSLHWGIHFVRAAIADYQRDVARAAIAAGADAILGGHPHILKGCELIDGKPVFYSLCNFATDLRMDAAHAASKSFNEIRVLAEEWEPDFDSLYNFPKASRLSMVARFEIAERAHRRGRASCRSISTATPCRASSRRATTRHAEVVDYMAAVTPKRGSTRATASANDMVEVEQAA